MSGLKQFHDATVLFGVFSKAAEKHGISWCKYGDESPKVVDARLIVDGEKGMDAHHELMAEIREACQCWNLGRNATEVACAQVWDLNAKKWKVPKEDRDDYVVTMARRVLNMCRVVGQAERFGGTVPAWRARLPWSSPAETSPAAVPKGKSAQRLAKGERQGSETSTAGNEASAEDDADWVYQYSPDHNCCTRRSLSGGTAEYSHAIELVCHREWIENGWTGEHVGMLRPHGSSSHGNKNRPRL